jgi:hypothetical protein
MEYVHKYFREASGAFDFMIYFGPVTSGLLVCIGVTAIYYFWREKTRLSFRHFLIFAPLLLVIGTISVGIFMRFSYMENPGATPPSLPSTLLTILFWLHFPLAAVIGYKLKEVRWLALAIMAFEIWFAFWCTFGASMSVTDDWL